MKRFRGLPADAHDWRVEVAAALRGLGDDVDIPGLLSKIDQERPSQRDGTSGLKEEIVLIRALPDPVRLRLPAELKIYGSPVADAGEEERKELIHLYGNSIVSCCKRQKFLAFQLGRIVGSRSRQFGRAVLQLEEQIAASEMTNHDQMQCLCHSRYWLRNSLPRTRVWH
jgi:hypothetical protein